MAASHIETFKEEAKVWVGDLPGWLALHGYQNSRRGRCPPLSRYFGGQPIMVVTGTFYEAYFEMLRMKNLIAGSFQMPSLWRARAVIQ